MAIAIKIAMISTTTINSMRVKPCSSSRRREASECRNCTWRVPLSCAGGSCAPRFDASDSSAGGGAPLNALLQSCARPPKLVATGRELLLDELDDVEHGQVQRDDHPADTDTH